MTFPSQHRVKPRSTNPLGRLNKEVKRRADGVGRYILPLEGCPVLPTPERGQHRPPHRRCPPRAERRVATPAPLHADRRHGRAQDSSRRAPIPHRRNRRRGMTDGRQPTPQISTTLTDATDLCAEGMRIARKTVARLMKESGLRPPRRVRLCLGRRIAGTGSASRRTRGNGTPGRRRPTRSGSPASAMVRPAQDGSTGPRSKTWPRWRSSAVGCRIASRPASPSTRRARPYEIAGPLPA